jgi:hypothetical protein
MSPNSNGTNNLVVGYGPPAGIAFHKRGALFTLDSIDIAISYYATVSPDTVWINGSPLSIDSNLKTYTLNLPASTSFTITGLASGTGYWTADNIAYTVVAPAPTVVPEPAMWIMMISGFGTIGVAARRRRISVSA